MAAESELWVEKHRPKSLDEVIGHDSLVERLKTWTADETMPNLLLAGPQGTGKTALLTAFARERYGEDGWRNNVLELNASDERGIDTVREKIKQFARQGTALGSSKFKIVFLDEVDQMTGTAQPALRRIMEDFSDKTRFVLSCNYLNKIIDPLQSRCVVERIPRLSDAQVRQMLERILSKEKIDYDVDAMLKIVESVDGDGRRAVNTLQAACIDGELDRSAVSDLVSVVDREEIREIVDNATSGEYESAMKAIDNLIKDGVNPQQLTDAFLAEIKDRNFPGPMKAKMIDKVGECDWRLLNGANPNIHFHKMIADIHIARHLDYGNYTQEKWQDDG